MKPQEKSRTRVEYYLINERPVKILKTPDGNLDVVAYDSETGEFVRALGYLNVIFKGEADIVKVSGQEFHRYLNELKARR